MAGHGGDVVWINRQHGDANEGYLSSVVYEMAE